jgi:lipid-A-disaccharide synthase-like uncharacterized protein
MSSIGIFDIIGWTGAVMILFGFYRTSVGKWTGKSLWYEVDNLLGSSLLLVYAVYRDSPVTIVLNAVWAVAALRGITSIAERKVKLLKKTQKKKSTKKPV